MSKRLEIQLFGPVSIALDGVPVTGLRSRKAEALLVYLACQKRPYSREALADLLWDDRPQDQALANLRSLLSGLNKQLGAFLTVTRHTVSFNLEADYWLDADAFARLLGAGDWGLGTREQGLGIRESSISNLQALEEAAALYRGDFLEGFYLRDCRGFEEWASLERERLCQLGAQVLQELVQYHLAHGSYAQGIHFADQLLVLNNLSERANRDKMLLLARSGQRNVALKQYDAYRQLLHEELGVAPAAETTAVYKRIKSSQAAPLHNLPPQATPFVGRTQELDDLQQHLIDPTCRLLTLLGPGGIGKTRLALAAAERIMQQQPGLFLHGIRLVPLTSVPTPDLLVTAVADVCDLTLQGQEPPLQQLLNYLQDKEMLLVLDNFEHLFGTSLTNPDGVDILMAMLQAAPLLQILITSRERLNVREEWVFDLDGLDYPPDPPQRDVEAYSAVQLFQQNAQRIQRQFAPAKADWAAMAQVCRLLEGMPLGIELAAAWTRDFSCPEIAQQIQTDVDFLTTKLRNVPPRHRSLTAVFDYSWTLLSAAEQAVFARLSIFRGSFSGEVAAAVAGADMAMLTGFCGKSLLREVENGRYELHELLRQYAADKLAAQADAAEQTTRRHMTTFLNLLADQNSGEKPEERHAIQTDLPNIRAAWQEAARRQEFVLLEKGTTPFHGFFSIQSKFAEGIDLFQFALEQLTPKHIVEPDAAQVVCELWGRKARMHIHIGQLDAAGVALDEAMHLLPLVEDPERHAVILSYAALTTYYAGDFVRATEMMTEVLQFSESLGDADGIAFAMNFLGSCAKALGNYETAESRFAQAVVMYQQLDDDLGTAMSLNNLGNVAQAQGDFATAQTHYLTCSELFKVLNHTHGAATTLANAGRLALKQEQYDAACDFLTESLALKRSQQDGRGTAVALVGLGAVSLAMASYDRAGTELCEAVQLAYTCGDMKLTLECLAGLAQLAAKLGHVQAATQGVAFVLAQPGTVQEVRDEAETFMNGMQSALPKAEFAAALSAGREMDLETAVFLFQTICSQT